VVPLPRHVYVHDPFCARRCAYCDFAIAVRKSVPVNEYAAALERELALRFPADESWNVDTLYFGGGTPSRLGGEGMARAIDLFRRRIEVTAGAELTIEANPEDVTRESVTAWRDAGVNRISLGSQTFDDRVLEWMHRTHDSGAIAKAVDTIRGAGIDNISLDLIFALPEHVERDWERDVEQALALSPSHLSLYGLTIESHTPLGRWHERGEVTASPDERYEREFLFAHDRLTHAGFEHYEVSNFGLPGRHSRHNAAYWTGVPYAGVGPSAHEFDGNVRRWNVRSYAEWVARLADGRDPIDGSEELTEENRSAEAVYLGLRTTTGLKLSGLEIARVERWVQQGWATVSSGDRLVLTPLGWLRLDALAADLTLLRSHY
jgi:oxygen-independent coproporphyrinogen-3 oxidase